MNAKLNSNPRARSYTLLIFLPVFSLATLSCGLPGSGEESKSEATQPPAGPTDEEVQVASLDTLGSYRGRLTMWIKHKDGSELTETRVLEWVREPPAGYYVYTKSNGDIEEQIVIRDVAWARVDVDSWRQMGSSHGPGGEGFVYIAAPIIHSTLSAIGPDGSGSLSKMTLVGEETVNGIHCKHYVQDGATMDLGIWVADQSDLPPVIVRALIQASPQEATDAQEAKRELNLYDLNAPIAIEPPE